MREKNKYIECITNIKKVNFVKHTTIADIH